MYSWYLSESCDWYEPQCLVGVKWHSSQSRGLPSHTIIQIHRNLKVNVCSDANNIMFNSVNPKSITIENEKVETQMKTSVSLNGEDRKEKVRKEEIIETPLKESNTSNISVAPISLIFSFVIMYLFINLSFKFDELVSLFSILTHGVELFAHEHFEYFSTSLE